MRLKMEEQRFNKKNKLKLTDMIKNNDCGIIRRTLNDTKGEKLFQNHPKYTFKRKLTIPYGYASFICIYREEFHHNISEEDLQYILNLDENSFNFKEKENGAKEVYSKHQSFLVEKEFSKNYFKNIISFYSRSNKRSKKTIFEFDGKL